MKIIAIRSLAWLTSLMLFISMFVGLIVLPVEAAVSYKYSGSYVYNWGKRDQLATFLSPMAEDFYTANNVTYADLAALSGSSTNSNVPSSALYKKLHSLMYNNLDNPTSYEDTKNLFKLTDCQNNASSSTKISSFYSGTSVGPAWDSGKTWNREHTWPNSKSNGGSSTNTLRETDIMMLRPASVSENSGRSNTAYGEGTGYYDPNKLGENVRGDVARIVLYVYVCWGGSTYHDGAKEYMWGTSGVIQSRTVLLNWMKEDPVDTWEMGRNDSVESITGTRNVFVDYPELAFKLFGQSVPSDLDSPTSGGNSGGSGGYTVKASTNNSNYGTVSVSGNVITASPQTGYKVNSYSILSGTATVTQNGNKFTVTPTSDVSIRINFAKADPLNLSFSQGGTIVATQSEYPGVAITLPAHSGAVPTGTTFVGWSTYAVSETTTAPTSYAAGSTWYVNKEMTLYALYQYTSGGTVYYASVPPVAACPHAYDNACDASCNICGAVRVVNHVYTAGCDTTCNVCGYVRVGETVIEFDANKTQRVDYSTATQVWQNGNLTITNNKANGSSNVGDYSAPARFYKGSEIIIAFPGIYVLVIDAPSGTYGTPWEDTLAAAGLTPAVDGSVYTVTFASPVDCVTLTASAQVRAHRITVVGADASEEHTYTNACDTTCNACGFVRQADEHKYQSMVTAPGCESGGCTTYTCSVCGDSYVGDKVGAVGHKYQSVVTAPGCESGGYTTYTCSVCGDSYVGDKVGAVGHKYDDACDADCNACGAVRQIVTQVLSGGMTSVSEEVSGLAFRFDAAVSGAQILGQYTYVPHSATVVPYVGGAGYKVVRMGAVMSNREDAILDLEHVDGDHVVDVEAKSLFMHDADSVSYAIRIINIPDESKDVVITARPYYVYEVDGEEMVVYGDIVSKSYNAAAE